MPFVVGALGVIKKKTENHVKRIPGHPCLQELQKIVLNGMAHLLRRVLSMLPITLFLHNQKINTIVVLPSKNARNFTFPCPRLLDTTRQGIAFNRKLGTYTSNDNNLYLCKINRSQLAAINQGPVIDSFILVTVIYMRFNCLATALEVP